MPWNLILLFPNLSPPVPTPYEADGICLCSADDARMEDLARNAANGTARRMLRRFWTPLGERYKPGCLLVRADARARILNADALRAFRDVCATATTTLGCAKLIAHPFGAQWTGRWTDLFVFGYHSPGRDGHVVTLDGAVRGLDRRIPRGQSTPQVSRPGSLRLAVDRPLLERLLIAWWRHFVLLVERRRFRKLFRSLEIAFHAGLFPGDGITMRGDVGTRLALWVSAFEVLCHPTQGDVNKREVMAVLRNAPFGLSALQAKRYTVSYQRRRFRASFPEALYDDLYAARNKFLHGNPVSVSDLRYRRSTHYLGLLDTAPVLYNVALLGFLRGVISGGPEEEGDWSAEGVAAYMRRRAGFSDVQSALSNARYRLDENGHPVVPPPRGGYPVVTPTPPRTT